MPSAGEGRSEPCFYYLFCYWFLRFRPTQNKDVGIIVFAARSRAIEIRHQSGTNPGEFIGGNRHADSARTDQDSSLGLSLDNAHRDFAAKIWIVDGFAPVGSAVPHVHVFGTEKADQIVLKLHSAVVTTDGDHH